MRVYIVLPLLCCLQMAVLLHNSLFRENRSAWLPSGAGNVLFAIMTSEMGTCTPDRARPCYKTKRVPLCILSESGCKWKEEYDCENGTVGSMSNFFYYKTQ